MRFYVGLQSKLYAYFYRNRLKRTHTMKRMVIRLLTCCSLLYCMPVEAMKEIKEEVEENIGTHAQRVSNPLGSWGRKKEKYRFFAALRRANPERYTHGLLGQNQENEDVKNKPSKVKLEEESQRQGSKKKKIKDVKIQNRISAQQSRDAVKKEQEQLEQLVKDNPEAYNSWLTRYQVTIKLEEQDQEDVSQYTQRTKNRISAQKSRDSKKEKLIRLRAFGNHLDQQIRDRVRIEEPEDAQRSEQKDAADNVKREEGAEEQMLPQSQQQQHISLSQFLSYAQGATFRESVANATQGGWRQPQTYRPSHCMESGEQVHGERVLSSSVFQRSPPHNRSWMDGCFPALEECFPPFVYSLPGNQ